MKFNFCERYLKKIYVNQIWIEVVLIFFVRHEVYDGCNFGKNYCIC